MRSVLDVHWKDWCWSWNSNTLTTSWEELIHWKRPWCWEGLGAGGEGDNRGWDGWMASLTLWTWVWVNSGSLWWTGRPGVLRFMGSQKVRHDWATELNWRFLRVPWMARRSNKSILKKSVLNIGRTDAEAPILWPPDYLIWRTDSLEKILMLGKIEGRRRRGWQRIRWLDGITDLMDMSLSKL